MASYSCSMIGYFPNDWTCGHTQNWPRRGRRMRGRVRTWTSWALTGFVATTLRAGAEEWKERVAEVRRPLARVFLSMARRLSRTARASRRTMRKGFKAASASSDLERHRPRPRHWLPETPVAAETNQRPVISSPISPHYARALTPISRGMRVRLFIPPTSRVDEEGEFGRSDTVSTGGPVCITYPEKA